MTTTDIASAAPVARSLRTDTARFTLLTPAIVRLEFDPTGAFEDRPTMAFPDRTAGAGRVELAVRSLSGKPADAAAFAKGGGEIETDDLLIRYDPNAAAGGAFTDASLSIRLKNEPHTTWTPGASDAGNLRGTVRTLDHVSGAAPLGPGLLSRDGWSLHDDSRMPVFEHAEPGAPSWRGEPWAVARGAHEQACDWYFFGHGRNYTRALREFTLLSGPIPLPPRYSLGVWWSRYWAYRDTDLKDIVTDFERHETPLDVLVIDMDWHLQGWTGYTWNPAYFPDPEAFLRWCHDKQLAVTLNLHPADGVGKHEAQFNAMRSAMGGGATMYRVPFDCTDPVYMNAYFDLLHRPLEAQGVDFWWMDWQQGSATSIENLDPLPWLNHLHWRDMELNPARVPRTHLPGDGGDDGDGAAATSHARPLVFSRWGGLGGHRYPIGFSGDTWNDWASLSFQPYFTATASNVGFGYWSHDIGGHQPGPVEPELYTRWVQYGVFSPIVRTHAGKRADAERRIWAFPPETFERCRDAFRFRYELLPYIYGMNRAAYDTGVSLCRPMYYGWPEHEAAYRAGDQYMFGDDLLIAPALAPAGELSRRSVVRVWLPRGEWTRWYTGRVYTVEEEAGRHITVLCSLDEVPVFVRAGAVVPTVPPSERVYTGGSKRVVFNVFPGEAGAGTLYDDDGVSNAYQQGECAWTTVTHEETFESSGGGVATRSVRIGPALAGRTPAEARTPAAEASIAGMPVKRHYELRFHASLDARRVLLGGADLERIDPPADDEPAKLGFWYDSARTLLHVSLPNTPIDAATGLTVETDADSGRLAEVRSGARGRARMAGELAGDGSLADLFKQHGLAVRLVAEPAADGMVRVRLGAHHASDDPGSPAVELGVMFTKPGCYRVVEGSLDDATVSLENDSSFEQRALLAHEGDVPGNDRVIAEVTVRTPGGERTLEHRVDLCPSINGWHVIGPFEVPFDDGLRTPMGPEVELAETGMVDVSSAHAASGGAPRGGEDVASAPLGWRWVERPPFCDVTGELIVDLNHELGGPHQQCVAYAATTVDCPEEMNARLVFGSDDGIVIWVNGREVFRHHVQRGHTSREQSVAVDLLSGENQIVVKVNQAGGGWMFSMHAEDESGRPIPGLRVVK
jgi:alpha-glucosidase